MRVAVIGAGVSGLGAAHVLARAHDVEVFEQAPLAGGHVVTVAHREGGRALSLDTGFIVHNERNYPLLVRLLRELGIATQESEMSFAVACGGCGLEWSGRRPFAQPRNAVRPAFVSMLAEVARWLRSAGRSLERRDCERLTLDEYVVAERYSRGFRDHFLVPLCSALWSTAPGKTLDFPAAYAIRFFEQHGMLGLGRFRWRTIRGGSRTYVDSLARRLGPRLRTGLGVRSLGRLADGVVLRTEDDRVWRFDKVVVATHGDQALRLLADPCREERRALGNFRYTSNEAVLHTDESQLPRAHPARSSWNFLLSDCRSSDGRPTITYYLNRLQRLDAEHHYCVTLNRDDVASDRVIARLRYEHPQYTHETLDAQERLRSLSGRRHTLYAGAHLGNGFHEDGLASGVRAAAALGVSW
jgi:uncharacterized protein